MANVVVAIIDAAIAVIKVALFILADTSGDLINCKAHKSPSFKDIKYNK
jgi:hypothetical protein